MIMCVDVSCVHTQSSSSSGVGKGAGVTIGVAVLAGLTYNVLVATWPIFLTMEIVGLCLVYRKSPVARTLFVVAGAVLAGSMWITRWAYRRYRKPSAEVVAPQEYTATLFVAGKPGKANKVIHRGPVPGVWTSADEVAAEVVNRYLATYGPDPRGELRCHAQPVAS
jgi:hypothetical protein